MTSSQRPIQREMDRLRHEIRRELPPDLLFRLTPVAHALRVARLEGGFGRSSPRAA